MQRLAREMNLSETVFVLPAEEGGDARIRIFTPLSELSFAGHPTLGTAFAIGTALGSRRSGSRRASGSSRSRSSPGGPGRVRADAAGDPELGAVRARGRAARRARRRALGAAGRGLRERPAPRLRRAREPGGGRGAPSRHGGAGRAGEIGANCFAGSGRRWKTRMFAPADGVPRTPRPDRPPARSRSTSAGTGGSRSARRSRSARAQSSAGRRSSYARASGSAERVERVEVAGGAVIVAGGRFSLASKGRAR